MQRGMSVAGEVWPSGKTMETLCLDAGLTAQEYKETVQSVNADTLNGSNLPKNPPCPPLSPERWNNACGKCAKKSSDTDRNKRSRQKDEISTEHRLW
jgi:hypothetical protein